MFVFTFGILLLVAIPVTVFVVMRRQELRKKAAPATTLALIPASITKRVGETFPLEVKIDTGENRVVAAEIHLVFDPEKLEAHTITNGPLFPNILASGIVDRGIAAITVGAASATTPVTGSGTAVVVRFKALAPTTTPISVRFASDTFVGSLGEGATNVLVGSTPATVIITTDSLFQPTTTPPPGLLNLSPSPTASLNPEATLSALRILSPSKDTSLTHDLPIISGKAPPGATVTITIYSNPITATAVADASGNWSFTPVTPLALGLHNVVASALDPLTGQTQTATTSFVVTAAAGQLATETATPVVGTAETTIVLITFGTLLIITGAFLPLLAKRSL